MKDVSKNVNSSTCVNFKSSNEILYQGKIIDCIQTCDNPTVSTIIEGLGNITCFNYNQLNSLSETVLGCLSSKLDCENKTLLNLFNLSFAEICDLKSNVDNLLLGNTDELSFSLDYCTPDTFSCTNICLFDSACLGCQPTQTISTILQKLISRTLNHSSQICDIQTSITSLQDQIDNLQESLSSTGYIPPTVTLDCGNGYWNGSTYVTYSTAVQLQNAISILDDDSCKIKSLLGSNSDFTDLKNTGNDTVFPNWTANGNNTMEVVKLLTIEIMNLRSELDAIRLVQEECCQQSCDGCMDNYFETIITNYGDVASGTSSTPTITLTQKINTQLTANCVGNLLDLNKSYYLITDGNNSATVYLSSITGASVDITLNSGTISNTAATQTANLTFNLTNLNIDYLKNVTIKLITVSNLDCSESYRVLIPKFENPICEVCNICLNKLVPADVNNYTATFSITYSGGGYATTTTNYTLNTQNTACVGLTIHSNQTASISNIIYSDTGNSTISNVELCSSCSVLGLTMCC